MGCISLPFTRRVNQFFGSESSQVPFFAVFGFFAVNPKCRFWVQGLRAILPTSCPIALHSPSSVFRLLPAAFRGRSWGGMVLVWGRPDVDRISLWYQTTCDSNSLDYSASGFPPSAFCILHSAFPHCGAWGGNGWGIPGGNGGITGPDACVGVGAGSDPIIAVRMSSDSSCRGSGGISPASTSG